MPVCYRLREFCSYQGSYCALLPSAAGPRMHYFFHLITEAERIVDPDGAEFLSLEAARLEANQTARDLMAGELIAGRTVPFGWRMQIADKDGTIILTIPFAALVVGPGGPRGSGSAFAPVTDACVIERAKATMLRAQKSRVEIKEGLSHLWAQLRTLAKMNAAFGRDQAPADL